MVAYIWYPEAVSSQPVGPSGLLARDSGSYRDADNKARTLAAKSLMLKGFWMKELPGSNAP